jgi:hypothetical protein
MCWLPDISLLKNVKTLHPSPSYAVAFSEIVRFGPDKRSFRRSGDRLFLAEPGPTTTRRLRRVDPERTTAFADSRHSKEVSDDGYEASRSHVR